MSIEDLANNPWAGRFGLRLCRVLPPGLGRLLADGIARWLNRQAGSSMVRAIRLNQWVVSGCQASAAELDERQLVVLRQITRSFYALFHTYGRPAAMQAMIDFPPRLLELIERSQEARQGTLLVGLHMSHFDLILQATVARGLRGFAISLPQTTAAIEWQHQLRRASGLKILPASAENFRQAVTRLQNGEVCITGMDYPARLTHHFPCFFGHPASLPVHYALLALRARVPVMIAGAEELPDRRARVLTSDLITLPELPDTRENVQRLAEMLLEVGAEIIRPRPQHWLMFHPLWPGLLPEAP